MLCPKLQLSLLDHSFRLQQLSPILPPLLFSSTYTINKPDWCQIPSHKIHFLQIGSDFSFDIGKEPFYTIGRNIKSSIIIEDLMMSRCHAVILHGSNGETYLMDLSSSHGTFIGKQKLIPYTPTLISKAAIIRYLIYFLFDFLDLVAVDDNLLYVKLLTILNLWN